MNQKINNNCSKFIINFSHFLHENDSVCVYELTNICHIICITSKGKSADVIINYFNLGKNNK